MNYELLNSFDNSSLTDNKNVNNMEHNDDIQRFIKQHSLEEIFDLSLQRINSSQLDKQEKCLLKYNLVQKYSKKLGKICL